MYTSHRHNVILLSSRFQYPGRRLFFTRARLFFDRIELSGWDLGKRHEQVIPIDELAEIEWDGRSASVVLHRKDGEPVRLRLAYAERWKHSLEHRLHWSTTTSTWSPASTTFTAARSELPLHELITFATSMG